MPKVLASASDGILTVTLNRPKKANALDGEMLDELAALIKNPGSQIHAILLRGEGKSFCAGADWEWMLACAQLSFEENLREAGRLAALYKSFLHSRWPIIARVQGWACGGGVGLTAAADVAICDASARFLLPEAKLGLIPGMVTPFLVDRVGEAQFLKMLAGQEVSSVEAAAAGLVDFQGTAAAADAHLADRLATDSVLKRRPRNITDVEIDAWAKRLAEKRASPAAMAKLREALGQ